MIGVSALPGSGDAVIIVLTMGVVVIRATLLAVAGPLSGTRWQGVNYATAIALVIFAVVAGGRITGLLG